MLAQSFKTAADLHIDDKQFTALCRVLAFMEQDQVVESKHEHANALQDDGLIKDADIGKPDQFNMTLWSTVRLEKFEHNCGTVACIGGWANLLAGERLFNLLGPRDRATRVYSLFMGVGCLRDLHTITVAEAAACLRHYLTTGNVEWRKFT